MKRMILFLILIFGTINLLTIPSYATVTSTTNQITYAGDGATSTFSFTFNVYNSASENDLVVNKVVLSTGVTTTLTINVDYTVLLTHSIPSPGTITLTAGALPIGTTLSILRQLPITQQVNIANNSATPASTTNQVYDRAIMISQQLQQQINRAVLQSVLSTSSITFPSAVSGQCIGWTGSTLSNLACSGSGGGGGGGGGTGFNPPIDDSQLQTISTANKVNANSIFMLTSLPAGAGKVPSANLDLGTSANQIVQLTAAGKYPAIDGSLITNISGANLTNLASTPSGSGIIPVANLGSGTPSSSNFLRGDGSFAVPATSFAPLSTTTVSAAQTTGDIAISSSKNYIVVFKFQQGGSGGILNLLFNADGGNNYNYFRDGRENGANVAVGAQLAAHAEMVLATVVDSGADVWGTLTFNSALISNANSETVLGNLRFVYSAASFARIYGDYTGAAPVTSFRLKNSSNMTGKVWVYELSQ